MDPDPPAPPPPRNFDTDEEHRLAPQARWVALFGSLIGATFFSVMLAAADFFWLSDWSRWPFEPGSFVLVAVPLVLLRALIYPFLWYRCWRFRLREGDLLVSFGVLWRVMRAVPYDRIQHIDLRAGPIDRSFELFDLAVYTAGSGDEDVQIPGIAARDAEALRDRLLVLADATAPPDEPDADAAVAGDSAAPRDAELP